MTVTVLSLPRLWLRQWYKNACMVRTIVPVPYFSLTRTLLPGVNHDCTKLYDSCTPYSYWGGESCGQASKGGDCANFVSQCLLAGGHTPLVKAPCRGYPCGKEEVGAQKLGACLAANYGWKSTCGAHAAPPADIAPGDVLLFHGASCDDTEAHATLVTWVSLPNVYVTAHSSDRYNYSVSNYASEFGFYDWLRAPA